MSCVKNLHSDEEWAQSLLLGDEWANYLTHGIGFILSLVGLILLIQNPFQENNYWRMLNFSIYGGSLVLLYAASTCYHAVRKPYLKKRFRTLDHCAIYLLIAGSYTPLSLLALGGGWGFTLFVIIWCLAFLGIVFKLFFKHRFKALSTALYLFMGWLIIIAAEPLMERFHPSGLFWLLAGGLSYTIGVIFYLLDKRRFYHAIWHLFVLGGSVCHYLAVLLYV
ncbi:MAG: hemolysin III family protein [Parachlamydiaceae bacterium]